MLIGNLLDVVHLALWQSKDSLQAQLLILLSKSCQHAERDYFHMLRCLGARFLGVGDEEQLDFALLLPIVLEIVFEVKTNSLRNEFKLGLLA